MKAQLNTFSFKLILVFITVVFSFLSCDNNDDEPFNPVVIEPVLVGKGSLRGSEGIIEQNIVFNNSTTWNATIELIDEFRLQELFNETIINFDEYVIIAVFDQVYPYLGNSIEISSIIEYEAQITVEITRTNNPSLSPTTEQPFHIVKIPITNKPIVFE